MIEENKQKIIKFYKKNIEEYWIGNPWSTWWINDYTQNIRFEALCNIWDLSDKSVLDVWCGYWALYSLISQSFSNTDYTWIDIMPEFIDFALSQNPWIKFLQWDFIKIDFSQKFDYVLASGALSHNFWEKKDVCFDMIKKMYEICTVWVAFNFLDKNNHPTTEDLKPYDFEEIYQYCKTITDKIFVSNDYIDYDFTIYLYK